MLMRFPWGDYEIPSVEGNDFIVKLGDFGTAEIRIEGDISVGQV